MKNNQSIRNYSNVTNSDKVRSNDAMKNSELRSQLQIMTRYYNDVMKNT